MGVENEVPQEAATPAAGEDEWRGHIAGLAALARVAEGEGDVALALLRLQKASLLAQSLGDHGLVGELLVECAHLFTSIGEYHEASLFLDRAKDIAASRDLSELKGEVYRGYGALYKARGDLRSAAVCFDRALERLEYSSRHRSVLRTLLELAEIYLKEGQTAQASHLLKRAENLPSTTDPATAVRLRLALGRLAYLAGDRPAAIGEYEAAAQAAERAGRPFERELIALGLAGLYSEAAELERAVDRLREALALSIVVFAREPVRAVERARFQAMGKRLLDIETAVGRGDASPLLRRRVEEAVRLFNAHPLVLLGEHPPYGSLSVILAPRPAADVPPAPPPQARERIADSRLPNPK